MDGFSGFSARRELRSTTLVFCKQTFLRNLEFCRRCVVKYCLYCKSSGTYELKTESLLILFLFATDLIVSESVMDLCANTFHEKMESRLFIGNLDYRINEGALIKMFSPYGKIISEDFLWHNRGTKRGEPRGYAFVEYSTKEEAKLAKEKMNGRLACGRPLVVRLANEKLPEETKAQKTDIAKTSKPRPMIGSASVPTCKSAKIAAIKSKLKDLEEESYHAKKAKHSEKD
ncbi:unnamed protein product [Rhodiola kirilowii]